MLVLYKHPKDFLSLLQMTRDVLNISPSVEWEGIGTVEPPILDPSELPFDSSTFLELCHLFKCVCVPPPSPFPKICITSLSHHANCTT